MNKYFYPAIIILLLSSLICIFAVREYADAKRSANPSIKKLSGISDDENDTQTVSDDGEDVLTKDRLRAEDTCILIDKDLNNKSLTLRNIKGGSEKDLYYDGKTVFLSKNDMPLVADELNVGDILDITFTTYNGMLESVKPSALIWEQRDISKFRIDEKRNTITVGDTLYMLNKSLLVASGDKVGEIMDVTSLDNLSIKGIDKEVYSIQIDKGHGYIRVLNDTYFVGGWIEIGQDIIRILSQDMLIPVPEGEYDIKVTNKGYAGRDRLTVLRDKETKLDLSKVEIEEVAIGHVQFDIKPDYAQLYVDGIITDFEERVPLEYGIHSIRAELAGYETVTANIRVGSEFANISIELDEDPDQQSYDEDDDDSDDKINYSTSSSSMTESSSSSSDTVNSSTAGSGSSSTSSIVSSSTASSVDSILSDNKKLYVQAPSGAEVYFDGKYIGIVPCSTNKIVGDHTVTLARDGYETKSYTISIANDNNDLNMSFSELIKSE